MSVNCKNVIVMNEDICLEDALGGDKEWRWCIYWYESGCYDGGGTLVACDDAGDLYYTDLSHCSCYGPGDGGVTRWGTLAAFQGSESVLDSFNNGVGEKIWELFGATARK